MAASGVVGNVLGLLLPPTCIACSGVLPDGSGALRLCEPCREALSVLVSQPFCRRCGHSVGPYATCAACASDAPGFSAAVRIGRYDGPLARMVRTVKYRGARYGAPLLADLLLAKLHQSHAADPVDLMTAVPLHWWRYYRRGYNQATWLARALRRRGLATPLRRVLVRTRNTRPQVGLSRTARIENVRGAFRVRWPDRVRGRRILLIDDVMTTGATAGACARELLRHGAERVTVAVAAVAEGGRPAMAS